MYFEGGGDDDKLKSETDAAVSNLYLIVNCLVLGCQIRFAEGYVGRTGGE